MAARARELVRGGKEALDPLPRPSELEERARAGGRGFLEPRRGAMYAIASMIAADAVQRALDRRSEYPPYGLAKSLFSDFRVMLAAPEPVPAGSVGSFLDLGKLLIDTTVFHLDAQMKAFRSSELSWLADRLDALLAAFRPLASPAVRARFRDAFAFMYGGMQFGASVCVQLAEVMTRVLAGGGLGPGAVAGVIARSSLPAHQLAGLNVDHVIPAYLSLQPPRDPGKAAPGPLAPAGWMDPENFALEGSGDSLKVVLRDPSFGGAGLSAVTTAYATQGCPARVPARGGASPITALWTWTAELSLATGLLGEGASA